MRRIIPVELAVVTSSRADYGHLYWLLRELEASPTVNVQLIAMGPHLSDAFGGTASVIEAHGFSIAERVTCLDESDTDVGMGRTVGNAMAGFTEVLARRRPDLVLIIADRYEMLAPAATALTLRIPIIHIEGGERSEGAIDNAVRNALTMMSHVHFTSTARARDRVMAMGEEPWRVHNVGAPSLDHLRRDDLLGRAAVEAQLAIRFDVPTIVVAHHPVTLDDDTAAESLQVLAALEQAIHTLGVQLVFCHPNADAGGQSIANRMREFCQRFPGSAHFHVNLEPRLYFSLLRQVDAMVGNSSSGIMESGSIPIGAVDVGRRQRGRERNLNVVHAPAQSASVLDGIRKVLTPEFRTAICIIKNIYGDGRSAARIRHVIEGLPDRQRLLDKRATGLDFP